MYDELPPRTRPLWWEGPAGLVYALVSFGTSVLVYNVAQGGSLAVWLWVLFFATVLVWLVGAVVLARWAGRRRTAVRQKEASRAPLPPSH